MIKKMLILYCAGVWINPAGATTKSKIGPVPSSPPPSAPTAPPAYGPFAPMLSPVPAPATLAVPATSSSHPVFNQGLKALQENRPAEAQALFLQFLKRHPSSNAGRFNLALSFYLQTKKPDPARAHLRQLLFENPYDKNTRLALRALGDRPYFWLWWSPDGFLAGMALSTVFLMIAGFRKTFASLKWLLPLWLTAHGAGGFYFYHRLQRHGSLIQDTKAVSAPDLKAPSLFTYPAGTLVKILKQAPLPTVSARGWSQVRAKDGKTGWVASRLLIPVNKKTK